MSLAYVVHTMYVHVSLPTVIVKVKLIIGCSNMNTFVRR